MSLQFNNVDYDQIRQEILNYIESLPVSEKWQDFVGSSGATIVDIVSALATFLSYNASLARQESYIYSAQLRTSLIGIANTLGYPVNRNTSAIVKVEFTAQTTQIWDKMVPIGSINDVPLSLSSSLHMIAGETYSVNCLIGEWNQEEFNTSNEDFQTFLISPTRGTVDNNYLNVYLDSIGVDLVKEAELADSEKLIEMTHPNGLLIISGNGYLARKLRKELMLVEYFVPEDPGAYSDVRLNGLTLVSVEKITPYIEQDSLNKLSMIIAGYRSTYRRGVNIQDHRYLAMSYQGIEDAAVSKALDKCCTVDISYLKNDRSIMNDYEKEKFIEYLEQYTLVGIGIRITDPEPVEVAYKATIYTEATYSGSLAELQEACSSIINTAGYKLGASVKIGELNSALAKVNGVSRVYIKYPLEDFQVKHYQYIVSSIDFTYAIDNNQDDKIGS